MMNTAAFSASSFSPKIAVMGVGGAGGNAIANMMQAQLAGVDFIIANTDAQALENTDCPAKIQLGPDMTAGLGAGADPEVGAKAAHESKAEIQEALSGYNMVFITAGMGGGTGTGAASVIAEIARELGVLTLGVITKPFAFEGRNKMRLAEEGIKALEQHVDTLLVIPNQHLFRIASDQTSFIQAFQIADEVLYSGVRAISDLLTRQGLVNLDFADLRSLMSQAGKAMLGTGEASGEDRAITAAEAAIFNPLLDDVQIEGAKGALINISGGPDMSLFEVEAAAQRIHDLLDPDANLIFGACQQDDMEGSIRVSLVATGIANSGKNESPAGLFTGNTLVTKREKTPEPTPSPRFLDDETLGLTNNPFDFVRSPLQSQQPEIDYDWKATPSQKLTGVTSEPLPGVGPQPTLQDTMYSEERGPNTVPQSMSQQASNDAPQPHSNVDWPAPEESNSPSIVSSELGGNEANQSFKLRYSTSLDKFAQTETIVDSATTDTEQPQPSTLPRPMFEYNETGVKEPALNYAGDSKFNEANNYFSAKASEAEEALIDIPAFLRRKANQG